jgi:hypothetical protein
MVSYSIYEMKQSYHLVVDDDDPMDDSSVGGDVVEEEVDALDVHPNQEDGAWAWNKYHRDDILFVHVALEMNDSAASLLDHCH